MSHHHNHNHNHNHNHDCSAKGMAIAFLLNLVFSVFELAGGVFTGSVAILSDALHDLGDAASIGLSFVLEKKSQRPPDATHTYGYHRYSVLGGLITTGILLVGSCLVIVQAIRRILSPTDIQYDGMLLFAVVGVTVNTVAALLTRRGDSINRKAVNLHMLEDALGWIVVLVGAVVMRFTNLTVLDPLMSIGVAAFILLRALENLREGLDLFLEKTPRGVEIEELIRRVSELDGVVEVHHLHLRSLDGERHDASLHAVIEGEPQTVKAAIREELATRGIVHVTIETEAVRETCGAESCLLGVRPHEGSHHRGHHHRHG